MSLNAPDSKDVLDIQFKIHGSCEVFKKFGQELKSGVNLLAVASNHGLLFAGNFCAPEFKVLQHKNIVNIRETNEKPVARVIPLPSPPVNISASCDGSLLGVVYNENASSFLVVYHIPSFLTQSVRQLHSIRLCSEDNVSCKELVWNPVIPNTLAVILTNGSLVMYNFTSNSYEFNALDKSQQCLCACWSPKGKQIVIGFPNGKIAQFKPDLKMAKTIECPPGVHATPFKVIAIQWLSTYQFAAVFLGNDGSPNLHIINAPKAGPPSYINYYDICYGGGGRENQVFLNHIQPWNLLLVTSGNSAEVGVLGTTETGEAPSWVQYITDAGRMELPLTEEKEDSFPIGCVLDTASSHTVIIDELEKPVMPMVHILSTQGILISYNFMNLRPNAPDVCSPPPPISDNTGGQFRLLSELLGPAKVAPVVTSAGVTPAVDMTFTIPKGSTSTPAKERPSIGPNSTLFGASSQGLSFAQTTATKLNFGQSGPSMTSLSLGLGSTENKPVAQTAPLVKPLPTASSGLNFGQPQIQQPVAKVAQAPAQPLYTVQPTYQAPKQVPAQREALIPTTVSKIGDDNELDDIIKQMIVDQIVAFDTELQLKNKRYREISSKINNLEEIKAFARRLAKLDEIREQAVEDEFTNDIQTLRHALNDSYSIIIECKTKLENYKNPEIAKLTMKTASSNANTRQIAKLESILATNRAQLQVAQQLVDAQWANYQDMVKRNTKQQMHIPSLEGIYQTLIKQKDILAREKIKINCIQSKLNSRTFKTFKENTTVPDAESLADSILSLTLEAEIPVSKLTDEKLAHLNEILKDRPVAIIRPSRPERVGLKSEVILETRIKEAKAKKSIQKLVEQPVKPKEQPSAISFTPKVVSTEVTVPKSQTFAPLQTKPIEKLKDVAPTSGFSFGNKDTSSSIPFEKPKDPVAATLSLASKTSAAPPLSFSMDKPKDVSVPVLSFGTSKPSSSVPFGSFNFNTAKSDFNTVPKSEPLNFSVSSTAVTTVTSSVPSSTPAFSSGFTAPSTVFSSPSIASFTTPTKPEAEPAKESKLESPFFGNKAATTISFGAKTSTGFSFGTPKTEASEEPKAPLNFTMSASSAPATVPTPKTDETDNLFGNLTICKPEGKTEGNIFGGNTQPLGSLFSGTPVSSSESKPSNESSFVQPVVSSPFAAASTTTATPVSSTFRVSSTSSMFGQLSTSLAFGTASVAPASTTSSFGASPVTVASTTSTFGASTTSTFGASPVALTSTAAASTTTSSSSSPFGQVTTVSSPFATASSTAAVSPFATAATTSASPFAQATSTSTPSVFGQSTATSTISSPFGAASAFGSIQTSAQASNQSSLPTNAASSPFAATPPSASVFGGSSIPKPDQSVFAQVASTPFGSTGTAAFSSVTSVKGGNIFSSGFGSPQASSGGSIFGGQTATGGSPFGTPSAATNTGSIFGGAQNQTTPSQGGSIFGGSAQPATSSIFGGSAFAQASTQSTGSIFGGGSGSFGSSGTTNVSSPFGAQAASPSSPFGVQPSGFGSNSAFGGGGSAVFGGSGFSSDAAPIAQSGFGSPQTANQPAFGAAPAFGANPTFGGGATFGSPKNLGFGSPMGSTQQSAFGGGQGTGMGDFGSLAQQGNTQNNNKPAFGGSAFTSYRG
ncbi:NUP214 family protein [Megaselia abdita]